MILIKLSYTFTTKKGRRMVHSLNGRTKVTGSVAGWMTSLIRRTQECKVSFTFNLQRRTSTSFYLVAYSDLDHVVARVPLQSQHYYHSDGLLAFPSLLQAQPVFDGARPHRNILQLLRIRTYQQCTYASLSCHPVRHL